MNVFQIFFSKQCPDQHDVTEDLLCATAHGDRPPDLLNVHTQVSSETPPPSQLSGLEFSAAHDDRPQDLTNDWLQESSSTLPPSQLSSLKSSPAVLGLQIFTCGQSSDFSRYRFKFFDEIDIDNIFLNSFVEGLLSVLCFFGLNNS